VAAPIGGPLGLDDVRGWHLRGAEVPDLAGLDEVGQRAECLVDVGNPIRDTHLVEVDPVGLKPAQRALDSLCDPPPRRTEMVGVVVAERNTELDGDYDVVAPPVRQRLAQDLLRLAGGIAIGGIDEVDAGVQRLADDLDRFVVIGVAERAEHHRAEA